VGRSLVNYVKWSISKLQITEHMALVENTATPQAISQRAKHLTPGMRRRKGKINVEMTKRAPIRYFLSVAFGAHPCPRQ